MVNAKKAFRILPEVYFMLSAVYYWTLAGHLVNYIAIGILVVLALQLIFQNKAVGMFIGGLLLLVNLFLVLALVSELREFPSFNAEARQMLIVGTLYLGSNLAMAGYMLFKNLVAAFSPETEVEVTA